MIVFNCNNAIFEINEFSQTGKKINKCNSAWDFFFFFKSIHVFIKSNKCFKKLPNKLLRETKNVYINILSQYIFSYYFLYKMIPHKLSFYENWQLMQGNFKDFNSNWITFLSDDSSQNRENWLQFPFGRKFNICTK